MSNGSIHFEEPSVLELALELINKEFHKCNKCGQMKPLEMFYKTSATKKGYKSICKECETIRRKKQRKSWKKAPKKKIKAFHTVDTDKKYESTDLTLNNYKEPLSAVEDGYGYYGTVSVTKDGEYVQCHICGGLYHSLPGHIWNEHDMKTRDYKKQFGLTSTTAMVSEEQRQKLKYGYLEYLKSLTPEEKEAYLQKQRAFARVGRKARSKVKTSKESLEAKNKKGTCPQQILAKIQECADAIGKTPSKNEFIKYCNSQRYVHLIYKVFGSWTNALDIAGLRKNQINTPHKRFGKHRYSYTDEELLDYLREYTVREKRIPTTTDFRRGLLPSMKTYVRRFGSVPDARIQAGCNELLEDARGGDSE